MFQIRWCWSGRSGKVVFWIILRCCPSIFIHLYSFTFVFVFFYLYFHFYLAVSKEPSWRGWKVMLNCIGVSSVNLYSLIFTAWVEPSACLDHSLLKSTSPKLYFHQTESVVWSNIYTLCIWHSHICIVIHIHVFLQPFCIGIYLQYMMLYTFFCTIGTQSLCIIHCS
jgi:hypothetical protein